MMRLLFSLVLTLSFAFISTQPLFAATSFWKVQAVDTMKNSRDLARNKEYQATIPPLLVKKASELKATHIVVDTPYDEEFYPVTYKWVQEARKNGLKVWFRGNFSGWEGWFDYPKFTNIDEHHKKTYAFITSHPELFEEGDIFTPAPEPENGIIEDPRGSDKKAVIFNKFLVDSYNNCVKAINQIQKKVTCGYFSVNGDIARLIITKDTVEKTGGVIVIDHYVTDPIRFGNDIDYLYKKFSAKVVLGEFGAPIPGINRIVSEEEQARQIESFINELYKRKEYVEGVNYWVLDGGSTSLLKENRIAKKAFYTIASYYNPITVNGVVKDSLGEVLSGIDVYVDQANTRTKTDKNGYYELSLPANKDYTIHAGNSEYQDFHNTIKGKEGQVINLDFTLAQVSESLLYKVRYFFTHLFRSFYK